MNLNQFVTDIRPDRMSDWAWFRYKETVLAAIKSFGCTSLLEVGGGRSPLFSAAEIAALGVSYTINDIEQTELDLAPDYVHKQCFDIGGDDVAKITERYDLVFSRFVFEHLSDTKKAYQNILHILAPGGVCLNYHPCLYTVPFVINKLLPNGISFKLLQRLFGGTIGRPKFPARYSWCFATPKACLMLKDVGFEEAQIIPFYGHIYYNRIPFAKGLHEQISRKLAKRDARWIASFAYTMARKVA